MNFYPRSFNLYLLAAVLLTAVCGCQSTKKEDKHLAMLRIHIENRAQLPSSSFGRTISVLRSQPVMVTINSEPVLTEADIASASVLDTPGGLAVQVRFNETGTYTLEQFTAAYAGKHFAIFGQWTELVKDSRWLAAPLINHRIANGELSFTPDASPEEIRQLVVGLNNMVKHLAQSK